MRFTPKAELDRRIARLQEGLKKQRIDGAVIVQNADLFYFTGTVQRSHLFVPAQGEPLLIVKKSLGRAKEESALENIIGLDSLKELKEVLQTYGYGPLHTLGFELDILPANLYLRYQKLFKPAEIIDISTLIRSVRMVKSPYEVEILRDIAGFHQKIYSLVQDNLREGMTELEMSAMILEFSRKHGHAGVMRVRGFNQDLFYVHLLSGSNTDPSYFDGSVGGKGVSPAFAQGSTDKTINRNEPVLIDYSYILDGYMLDQTRVFCIGTLPDALAEAHTLAVDILKAMEKIARPGVLCSKLYETAMQMAAKSKYAGHFLGFPDAVTFIGHGVGIELDELPVIASGFDIPLEEGMVFAMEPKFAFAEGAVGLENTYVVTKDGLETLTVFEEGIIYI